MTRGRRRLAYFGHWCISDIAHCICSVLYDAVMEQCMNNIAHCICCHSVLFCFRSV